MTGQGVVEPFNQLNTKETRELSLCLAKVKNVRCTLAASTGTDQRDVCTRLDLQRQVAQDTHAWAGGVLEVDVFEADVSFGLARIDLLAIGRVGVNLGHGVEELDDVGGSTFGA